MARQAANTKDSKTVIELLSYREWLIVRDADTYNELLGANLPLTTLHRDTLSIVQPIIRKANLKIATKPWTEELEAVLDAIRARLKCRDDDVRLEDKTIFVRLPTEKSIDNLIAKLTPWFHNRSFGIEWARREMKGKGQSYWWLRGTFDFNRHATPVFLQTQENEGPSCSLKLDENHEIAGFLVKKPVPHLHLRVNTLMGSADAPLFARDIPFDNLDQETLTQFAAFLLSVAQRVGK